jgi:uncharacterized protein (TIGR00730 family)
MGGRSRSPSLVGRRRRGAMTSPIELRGAAVAVFGSSEPAPADPLYRQAFEVGAYVARAGGVVVTGGYGGVMEAASRGAHEAGGRTLGITCRIFSHREPNSWLAEARMAEDLHDRQRGLIDAAQGYIVLRGRAGTLAEVALLWALQRTGCLGQRPVILLGARWERLLQLLAQDGILEDEQLRATYVASTPHEAVATLARRIRAANGDQD